MKTTGSADYVADVVQKKESIWDQLLNLLFPRKCAGCGGIIGGGVVCGSCLKKVTRLKNPVLQTRKNSKLNGLAACFDYSGTGSALMRQFKFHGQKCCYDLVLRQPFEDGAKQLYQNTHIDMVVAVPMYPAAKRERGFNQAEYIAQHLAKAIGRPYREKLLQKVKKNKVQHLLSAEDRGENVKGAYWADAAIAGKTVLVVDDITTTGATLEECAVALKIAGAACVLGLAVMNVTKK